MALCKDTSLKSTIDDDFLTCKLCSNFYQQPKILPCTHTYCTPCIQALLDKSDDPGSISCPECGERITLPYGTVSDLKTNNIITAVTKMFKENGNTLQECSACRLRRKLSSAKSHQDCGDYLCSGCSGGHSACWKQKVVLENIEEESCEQEVVVSQSPACPEHDDEGMEYFCETCKMPVCASCLMSKHRDHQYITSTEAVTLRKNIIMNVTRNIRGKLKVLKKREEIISNKLSSIQETKAEVKQNIDDHISNQIALLERQRESALLAVNERAKMSERKLETLLNSIQDRMSLTGNCLELFDSLMAQCEQDDFLLLDGLAVAYLQLEQISLTDPRDRGEAEPDSNTKHITDSSVQLEQISLTDPCSCTEGEPHNTKSMSDNGNTEATQPETSSAIEQTAIKRSEKPPKISLEFLETLGETADGTDCRFSFVDFYGLLDIKRIEMPHRTVLIADKADGKLINIYESGYASADTAQCFFPFHISKCGTIIDSLSNNTLRAFQNKDCTYMLSDDDMPHAITSFRNNGYIVGHQKSNEFQIYDTKGNLQEKCTVPISYPLANISVDHLDNITTCEWGNNSVRVWSHKNGSPKVLTIIPSMKANAACVDSNDLVYTVEKRENKLSVFDKSGPCLLQHLTTHDGLENPVGLVFDKEGLMYVISEDDVVNVYKIICE